VKSAILEKLTLDLSKEMPVYTHPEFKKMGRDDCNRWSRKAFSEEYCLKNQSSEQTLVVEKSNSQEDAVTLELDSDKSIASSSPPPVDSAHILCRCGIEADGHRTGVEQTIVKCADCGNFTHLACLVNREKEKLSGRFECHLCDISELGADILPQRRSERLKLKKSLLSRNLVL
jgi:hypothetical protein